MLGIFENGVEGQACGTGMLILYEVCIACTQIPCVTHSKCNEKGRALNFWHRNWFQCCEVNICISWNVNSKMGPMYCIPWTLYVVNIWPSTYTQPLLTASVMINTATRIGQSWTSPEPNVTPPFELWHWSSLSMLTATITSSQALFFDAMVTTNESHECKVTFDSISHHEWPWSLTLPCPFAFRSRSVPIAEELPRFVKVHECDSL